MTEGEMSFRRYPELSGVEVLRVTNSRRHWRWYHTDYSVCTPVRFEGRAEFMYRGCLQVAGPLQHAIMEPGEVHATKSLTAPASYRVLFLPPAVLARTAEELGMGGRSPHFAAAPFTDATLLRTLQRLHGCLESPTSSPLERQIRFADGLEAIVRLSDGAQVLGDRDPLPRQGLARARDYLDSRTAENVSLDDLAGAAGVSRFHVARAFARAVGLPPHAYQLLVRIDRARRLLAAGASVEEAAGQSGFIDGSHLRRHFKRVAGVAPGAYARAAARSRRLQGMLSVHAENAISCD